jgi:hypothetical protein
VSNVNSFAKSGDGTIVHQYSSIPKAGLGKTNESFEISINTVSGTTLMVLFMCATRITTPVAVSSVEGASVA